MRDTTSTRPRKERVRLDSPSDNGSKVADHRAVQSGPVIGERASAVAEPDPALRKHLWLLGLVAAAIVFVAYANHFQNSFHFDDSHTIVDNVYIRDLHYIPRYFTDATTFSTLPANQTWRPLVSLSLAIDYRLGGGLRPLWFHISTFFWFLIQLALMYVLYRSVLNSTARLAANPFIALFAALWYGLHPAIAETVNYVVQRADLYSTLGVVAGLVVYIRFPKLRKFGLYLLPVIAGALSKAPSVVFGGILLVYIFLFEEDAQWNRLAVTLLSAAPSLVVCAILAVLNIKLTSKTYVPAGGPSSLYWAVQPYVLMRYVRSFFLPLWLSADSDLTTFPAGFADPHVLIGLAFCIALLAIGFLTIRRREYRPIAFGIFWFFGASAPTSLFVLAEVENDHRMFFPFVGLMLSVTWAAALLVFHLIEAEPARRKTILRTVQVLGVCLLAAFAVGTWQRNRVWRSEDSLWLDVTQKSPQNGRGLMNYGLTLMAKGDARGALDYYQRAAVYTPYYYVLEINTGIVEGLLNDNQQAEAHFRRAIALMPRDAQPYFYYGRWLDLQGRMAESVQAERSAIQWNPAWMDPRYLLMQLYQEQGQWADLRSLAQDTLKLVPADTAAQRYLAAGQNGDSVLAATAKTADATPTADGYLNLSLAYNRAGKYQESVAAAQKALRLKPDYAEAYNNIAAADAAMSQWDQAIAAAQQAVRLKPNFQLAKNNLAWAESQKKLQNHLNP